MVLESMKNAIPNIIPPAVLTVFKNKLYDITIHRIVLELLIAQVDLDVLEMILRIWLAKYIRGMTYYSPIFYPLVFEA